MHFCHDEMMAIMAVTGSGGIALVWVKAKWYWLRGLWGQKPDLAQE